MVNEVGEIGIDGELMKQLDLNVWKLYSGCICCILAGDLVPTLEKIANTYNVDVTAMEPSGFRDS